MRKSQIPNHNYQISNYEIRNYKMNGYQAPDTPLTASLTTYTPHPAFFAPYPLGLLRLTASISLT